MKDYQTGKPDSVEPKAYGKKATKQQRETLPGSEKAGKVSRSAVGAERTKGGSFPKFAKGSKESKKWNAAYKNACGEGKGGTFSYQGRSYACSSKASPKKPEGSKLGNALLKAGLLKKKKISQ